tara:strand:+ start:1890 stop:2132 length:243 start_codon:yes stop_codon:yes gene_type:complete
MKQTIRNWLFTILKDYPEKEIKSIYQNYVDDYIGFNYLKEQYKTNKKTFEINLLNDLKQNKELLLKQKQDYVRVFRPPKL